jgi:hypothetical protein
MFTGISPEGSNGLSRSLSEQEKVIIVDKNKNENHFIIKITLYSKIL